jgi:rare lipoprotein A (peptidoglycan hydrolase)
MWSERCSGHWGESVLLDRSAEVVGASPSAHPVGVIDQTMRIAFAKHTLSFALAAALLGPAASLALPSADALASTTGGAAASTTSATPTTATTATTATTTATTTDASAPGAGATAGGTTGGAAPSAGLPSGRTLATWFGPGFYGHTTACGQTMSPTLVGVASRTLACGTLVQFAYHGHELTVPVLDRGPYGHIGAVWDLTAGAAHALKIRETVHLLAKVVGSTANTPTLGEAAEASPLAESSASTPAAPTTTATGGAAAA